ncbi:DNA alkylation repair protein [Bauldia sp.]|uniref:DNA alkylation repair protein n=1 Tax=Bauldia sp. TaxID=2575872 RepID=UPI003BADB2C2
MNTATTVLTWLKREGSAKGRADMTRYAIPNDRAFGVAMGVLKQEAKAIGTDHALAASLWETGWYEARTLAVFVDDPALVTADQMERWVADFDNWAICDTACFSLFDRTAHAWDKVDAWAGAEPEFVKRAAFALIWSLSAHDKAAPDARFQHALTLIAGAADDGRNFVKKGVDMALRAVGKRNPALHAAALTTARTLAESDNTTRRWIGRKAVRELDSDKVRARLGPR